MAYPSTLVSHNQITFYAKCLVIVHCFQYKHPHSCSFLSGSSEFHPLYKIFWFDQDSALGHMVKMVSSLDRSDELSILDSGDGSRVDLQFSDLKQYWMPTKVTLQI